jgi:glucose-6-phosphate-specific signal transduction histidine kinase
MNPIFRNVLAVIVGLVVGGCTNMAIITISPYLIPPPPGADFTTVEGLNASMHLMQPKHFILPFLAHASQAFLGAVVCTIIAATNHFRLAMIIGAFSLLGGIMAVRMIPAPMWFNVLDLAVAYIPMSFLGYKLALRFIAKGE